MTILANHVARILKTETASLESDGAVSFHVPYLRSYSKGIYGKLKKKKRERKMSVGKMERYNYKGIPRVLFVIAQTK